MYVHMWWTALGLFLSKLIEEGSFYVSCSPMLQPLSLSRGGKDV